MPPHLESLVHAIATTISYGPGLADLIQIVGAGGGAFGGFVGLMLPTTGAASGRQMRTNVSMGITIGGCIGTIVAFAIWAAIRLNGGVG